MSNSNVSTVLPSAEATEKVSPSSNCSPESAPRLEPATATVFGHAPPVVKSNRSWMLLSPANPAIETRACSQLPLVLVKAFNSVQLIPPSVEA